MGSRARDCRTLTSCRNSASQVERKRSRTRELNSDWKLGFCGGHWMNTQADPRLIATIRFLLACGQRKSEVLGATIRANSRMGGGSCLPSGPRRDRPHRIPVTKTMAELIGDGGGLVFPSPVTGRAFEARAPNHLLAKMTARGQLHGIPSFTVHDLRRAYRGHA